MMRPVLILTAIALASANDLATCAANGAESMDNIVDVALNIWAATKRCGKGASSDAQCAVDISASVKAVNDMINTIVGAVEGCGAIHTSHHPCGMAVSKLTSASAGLAEASAGIIASCHVLKQTDEDDGLDKATSLGKCIMDGKSSLKSLFSASGKFTKIHADCNEHGGRKCNENAIQIVSALADMGSFLAAAVDDCSSYKFGAGNEAAACVHHSLTLVSALDSVAHAGMEIANKCKVTKEERLYLENDEPTPTGSSMPLALAALLPISVVLSFVAGSRFAKARARNAREADCEQLMEEE